MGIFSRRSLFGLFAATAASPCLSAAPQYGMIERQLSMMRKAVELQNAKVRKAEFWAELKDVEDRLADPANIMPLRPRTRR